MLTSWRMACWGVLCLIVAGCACAAPVAYWSFDEASGTAIHDSLGNTDEGRLANATWTAGHAGGGLQFAGTGHDSFVRVPDCEALRCERSFTVQFWWQKTSDTVQIFVRKGEGSRANFYAYYEGALNFAVTGADGRATSVVGPRVPDGWHRLAFTCDGQRLAIILDGAEVAAAPLPGGRLFTDESDLLIGTYAPGYKYCLAGVLDDLCLSDVALTADQLDAELTRGRAAPATVALGQTTAFKPTRGALVLARGGRPGATIVIARDATDLQRAPARELQRVVQKITGARLPLRTDDETVSGSVILVGASALTRKLGLPTPPLTGDAFRIQSAPGRLVLLGHDDLLGGDAANAFAPGRCKAGTSNAVQAFLHDICGVRWYMPGTLGEIIPKTASLEVPLLDRREQPARQYVLGSFTGGEGARWARRQLFGSTVFIKHLGGHLWYSLIPAADGPSAEQYFAEHPDWFALLDGQRTGEGNHLCVTNRGMFAEAVKNLKAIYAQGYEWVEMGQTDGWRRCRCELCEAQDNYRTDGWWVPGVPADRIFQFHTALAEEVLKTYPDRKVLMISYGPTGEVPSRVKRFPDNVVVEWTHDPPELLARWGRFHHAFASYVYWFGLYHPLGYGPKSSPAHVAAELRRHRQAGSQAFFLCGGDECWGTEGLTYYVMSELFRNPRLDEKALVRDFCTGLFGKAGGTMERYFACFLAGADDYQSFTRIAVKAGQPFMGPRRTRAEISRHCFPPARLAQCATLLDRAATEVTDDASRRRVQFFRDGFDTVRLHAAVLAAADRKDAVALSEARQELAAVVARLGAHQQDNGMDLPPVFRASPEDLLKTPDNG